MSEGDGAVVPVMRSFLPISRDMFSPYHWVFQAPDLCRGEGVVMLVVRPSLPSGQNLHPTRSRYDDLKQIPRGQDGRQRHHQPALGGAPQGARVALAQVDAERQALVPEGDVLLDGGVPALAAGDVQVGEVVGREEEHVGVLGDALEAGGVVGELEGGVGGGGVAEEDALDLVRVLVVHGRVVAHDVRVGGVGDEDELALGVGGEDDLEEVLADGEGGGDVGEVEGPRVEGAARVGGEDELLVVAGDLLGQGGEVVEVCGALGYGQVLRPVRVDGRHVEPGDVGAREGVEDYLGRQPDPRDAQDVVDVAHDGQALRWHEVGGRVADVGAVGVDVEALDLVRLVAGHEAVGLDGHEGVEVALGGGVVGELDGLIAAAGRDGAPAARLARRSGGGSGGESEDGRGRVAVLHDEDLSRDVAGLISLVRGQLLDGGANQKVVGMVVEGLVGCVRWLSR